MDSPHSSTTSAAMLVYQILLSFFPLKFSKRAWYEGYVDETSRRYRLLGSRYVLRAETVVIVA